MHVKYQSSLSLKRIIISLCVFCMIPVVYRLVLMVAGNETAAMTFTLNLTGLILIIYDWNLFGIHYNRAKANPKDALIYTIVGTIIIAILTWINQAFLKGYIPLPDAATVNNYLFSAPAVLLAYSVVLGFIVNISFKCLTDHLDIRDREALIILASGFLFGILYTAVFVPFGDLGLLVRTYLYNVLLICTMSYLYNQSHSFIPGIISFTIIMLLLQYMTIFA